MASFPDIAWFEKCKVGNCPGSRHLSPLFHSVADGDVVTAPCVVTVVTGVSVGAVEGPPGDVQVGGAQDGHHPPALAPQADQRVAARAAGQLTGEPVWPTLISDLGPEAELAARGEADCGGGDQEGAAAL